MAEQPQPPPQGPEGDLSELTSGPANPAEGSGSPGKGTVSLQSHLLFILSQPAGCPWLQ